MKLKIAVGVLIFLVLVLLGLGGFYYYRLSLQRFGEPRITEEPPEKEKVPPVEEETAQVEEEPAVETMSIFVYFPKWTETEAYLVEEEHVVPKTPAVAKTALEELIKGEPLDASLKPIIPKETKILGVRVGDGLATVDFSREILQVNVGAQGEVLGIYSIVNTLTQFPTIKRVQFLVEGRSEGEIDGRRIEDWWGHIGLFEQPFSRNDELVPLQP
ncbi:MAG: GerMN domain-containing protein [Actinomycetota bacterium]|nr:GerMN domain-containing protein [Actinomycetota bacterium]